MTEREERQAREAAAAALEDCPDCPSWGPRCHCRTDREARP